MGKYDTIGQLMHLPLENISVNGNEFSAPEFIVGAAADAIVSTDGRNWIPVIVKETGDYQYEVVTNHFVYAVAQQANLERVWCIIIEPKDKVIEQARILAREATPKVNLSNASGDSILAALRYLSTEPSNLLKGVDIVVAANRIETADRSNWKDLNPITKLKCGITKAKLDALSKVFYVEAPPAPPAPPEAISIKKANRDEIFDRLNYLFTYKIGGFQEIDPDQTADSLFTAIKTKWKSLTPITKLDCGIDTAKLKTLKTVFTL